MTTQCSRCLKVTDTVHTCTPTTEFGALELRIAELEAEVRAEHQQYQELSDQAVRLSIRIHELDADLAKQVPIRIKKGRIEELEQEVARLSDHIRSIAEHHDAVTKRIQSNFDGGLLEGEVDYEHAYHLERRDFALSGLEGKTNDRL